MSKPAPVRVLSADHIGVTKDNAKVGMAVEARYDRGQTVKFYPGVISRVYRDGTFGITFADGDVEKGVRPEWVRFPLNQVKDSLAGELAKIGDSPEMISAQLNQRSSHSTTEKRAEKKRELLNIGAEHLAAPVYSHNPKEKRTPTKEASKAPAARSDSPRSALELTRLQDSSQLQGAGPKSGKRSRSAPEVLNIGSLEGKDYDVTTTPKKCAPAKAEAAETVEKPAVGSRSEARDSKTGLSKSARKRPSSSSSSSSGGGERSSLGASAAPRAPIKRSNSTPSSSSFVGRRDDEKQGAAELAAAAYEELAGVYAQLAAARDELVTARVEQEESAKQLEALKTERDGAVQEADSLREENGALKKLVLDSKQALLASGLLPLKRLSGRDLPPHYQPADKETWALTESVPWNKDKRCAMTPSEGVAWLAAELARERGGARSRTRHLT